jgi:hypothetical protein
MIVLIDCWLDFRLMEAVVEDEAVEAPVCAKDQEYVFVILRSGLERVADLLLRVRIIGIQLSQFGRNLVLRHACLLRDGAATNQQQQNPYESSNRHKNNIDGKALSRIAQD